MGIEGQMSIFDVFGEEEHQEEVGDRLKCFRTELKEVNYKSVEELFSGYNIIQAITFSYDIGFIEKIVQKFDYAEILLGAEFMTEKDVKLQTVLAQAMATTQHVKKHKELVERLSDGKDSLQLKIPSCVLDHRKIYLLKADSGKTRVIISSANMSGKAWNGSHMECYSYDDTPYCYEEYLRDFETVWGDAVEITKDIIVAKQTDNPVADNILVKKVKECNKVMTFKEAENTPLEIVEYVLDASKWEEKYGKITKGIETGENGIIEIKAKTVERMEQNERKLSVSMQRIEKKTENYPQFTFDLYEKKTFLDGEDFSIQPTREEVLKSIDQLLSLFNNFDKFINGDKLKETYFKFLNLMFVSPFHAKLRCVARRNRCGTDCMPLYVLLGSTTANCGKTFMCKAILKMMTGKELNAVNVDSLNKLKTKKDESNATLIGLIQGNHKGVPFVIDEVTNQFIKTILPTIKNVERCEDDGIDTQPLIVFTSNAVTKPSDHLRKRMVFFPFESGFDSTTDVSELTSAGIEIINSLETGLYREYLRRILDVVDEELNTIAGEKPSGYYPKILEKSSDVLIQIFEDFGVEIPFYVKHLTWKDDYSMFATDTWNGALEEIENLYYTNKKLFSFSNGRIIIDVGNDMKKKCDSWKNVLPAEMEVEVTPSANAIRVVLNKAVFEKKLGYKLNRVFGEKKKKRKKKSV